MAMFVSRAQMSSRCWCQSEVSGGWKHLLRALGSGSKPQNFVGYLSALSFPGAEMLLAWRGGPVGWAVFMWVQKMALTTCDGLGRAGKGQATPGKQLLSPSTPSGAVLGAMGPAAAWFLPGGKASSSVLSPPPPPGGYCKGVQDETPSSKRFLPVSASRSASCKQSRGGSRAAPARAWQQEPYGVVVPGVCGVCGQTAGPRSSKSARGGENWLWHPHPGAAGRISIQRL